VTLGFGVPALGLLANVAGLSAGTPALSVTILLLGRALLGVGESFITADRAGVSFAL
jgi:hypothetical protein